MGSEDINTEERQFVKITTLRERVKKLLTNSNKVLWSLQPEVISNGLLDKLSEQDIRLEELKFAVFSSEVAFNMEMTELVNLAKRSITWIDPLAISTRRAIARTTEGVKRTSNTLLGHLEKEWAQSTTITMQKMYEALSDMIPQFQNYVTYCMHQEELRSVLENAMFKKDSLLKASFSERMNVERVLLPLQRLQTLRLLLQEIRHELIPTTYTNENNSCKKALYKVTEFLDECYKHLAVLQGPEYTKKLNDALENNAYHYGLGIAVKAENGSGRIDNLISFHDNLQEYYIPRKISRHGSLLPRVKQDVNAEKIRHSYEGFSSPEGHRSNCSSIQDEYQELNLPPIFKEASIKGNNEIHEKLIRDNSNVSQDSGISCESWAHILTPSQNFNELNSYKIETSSDFKPSNQYFTNEVDENKLHADECNNSDCVFCKNNINECFNYILIGEIEHSFKYDGEMKNENFKVEAYNSDAEKTKSQTNTVPALILQQLFIAPPKLLSMVNKQQVHKHFAFSKINEEPLEAKITNDAFFDGITNPVKDVQSLERNNNLPKVQNMKHEEELIKFPDSYKELHLPKNANICLMPIKTSTNKICLAGITTKQLENSFCLENNVISTSADKEKLLALYLNNKLAVSAVSKPLNHEHDIGNEQNEEPEDHIYAEPMYCSYSSSLSSSLQNITCSESSTPTESDALSINSESPNIYDVPAAHIQMSTQGFKRSTLSLCHLSASLAEDRISRKTLLSACEDVPLYQISLQQEKCPYVDTEDGYIEPMPHIYEDIDTILAGSPELDRRTEMSISRPTEQCQRLRWAETFEVKDSRLTDKLNSTEIALQEAKFEIITSEVSYFKSLCILESIFMDSPLLADRVILSQKDYEALFSAVQKVKKCSQQLLAALTASFQEDLLLNNLCNVVSEFVLSGALQVYVDYCKNHSHMEDTLTHLRETNPTFTSILKRLEEDSACQMCSLQSFLTLPMQRVTRFPLLIKAVLRYLPIQHSESHIWKLVLFELNKLVESCNDAAGEVQGMNERLISLKLSQQPVGKKKSKHFWRKFKPRKSKI